MPPLSADGLTISLLLLAAFLHASWNAMTKSSGDPLVNLAVVTSTGGIAALPLMLALPIPTGETWGWLAFSAAIHFIYQASLIRTYRVGDLSQVYPIARGLAPLGVAMLGALFANEHLELHQTLGLLLSSCAIIALGRSGATGESNREAVAMAALTAFLIGLYTYSDAQGVRSVGRAEIYIAWSFFLGAAPLALTTVFIRGRSGLAPLRRGGLRAIGGGIMATVGYSIALWALARAPMASVSSLRESSVLFAALIGTQVLGESFGRVRVIAALLLVAGLGLVQLEIA